MRRLRITRFDRPDNRLVFSHAGQGETPGLFGHIEPLIAIRLTAYGVMNREQSLRAARAHIMRVKALIRSSNRFGSAFGAASALASWRFSLRMLFGDLAALRLRQLRSPRRRQTFDLASQMVKCPERLLQ